MRPSFGLGRSGVAFALAVGLLAIGCAIPPSGHERSVAWTVGDTGLTLAPPVDKSNLRLSSLDAYQRCIGGQAACGNGSPTAIELALAIDPGTNLIDPAGTLVWAIEWLGIPCPPSSGGPDIDPSTRPTPPPIATPLPICDEIAIVDANTGTYLFTQVGPHDPARP